MIIRRKHNSAFTIVPNAIASDERLSIGARWLMLYLLSKPDDWIIRAGDIMKVAGIGKNKAYSLVRECIDAGYIRREKQADGYTNYEVRDEGSRPVPKIREQGTEPNPQNPDQALPNPQNRDTYKELTSLLKTDYYKKGENSLSGKEKRSVWIVDDDPRWPSLVERWKADNPGKRLVPRGSRYESGQGEFFPATYLPSH